jgi:hypothetical protein
VRWDRRGEPLEAFASLNLQLVYDSWEFSYIGELPMAEIDPDRNGDPAERESGGKRRES